MYAKLMKLAITVILIIFSLQYIALAEEAATDKDKKTDKLTVEQEAAKRDSELIQKLMLQSQQTRSPDPKVKEREDCNHRNTLKYFEDYNLSVTQRLFKRAVSGWALFKISLGTQYS